ncbi:MAG TPA: amidohydrolase [Clostridiaceae bacterium]|nr:amidohydrolase [Clostridiaceae bacterium]
MEEHDAGVPYMVLSRAKEIAAELTPLWADLHRHPELSFKEYRTSERLKKEVEGLGLEVIDLGMETGFLARLRGGQPGRKAAIRTDLDAIAILESPKHEVRSGTDGVMHACGHDFHMTAALGAARLLKEGADQLQGDVYFVFQPAEEIMSGARVMLDSGLLEALPPDLDALFGLHALPHYPAGTVLSGSGYASAGKTDFRIRYKGTAGHGGSPHEYQDVIPASAAFIQAVQTLVSRENDPQKALVAAVLTARSEGEDYFVSDALEMTGAIRAFDEQVQEEAEQRIAELAENIATAYGCQVEAELSRGVPAQKNDPDLLPAARRACRTLFSEDRILTGLPPFLGAEDFALFGRRLPSHFYWLGTGFPGRENALLHQPEFQINPQALPLAIALLTQSVLEVLEGEEDHAEK